MLRVSIEVKYDVASGSLYMVAVYTLLTHATRILLAVHCQCSGGVEHQADNQGTQCDLAASHGWSPCVFPRARAAEHPIASRHNCWNTFSTSGGAPPATP